MVTFYSNLPLFTGFYSGVFNFLIENEEQRVSEDYENVNFDVDYSKTKENVSKECVEQMKNIFSEIGITDEISWERLDSPQYYNYSTDRIVVKIEIEDVDKWISTNNKLIYTDEFKEHIEEAYSPCAFYRPNYSNSLKDWEKMFADKNIEELWYPITSYILKQKGVDTMYLYHEVIDTGVSFLEYTIVD